MPQAQNGAVISVLQLLLLHMHCRTPQKMELHYCVLLYCIIKNYASDFWSANTYMGLIYLFMIHQFLFGLTFKLQLYIL